MAEFFTNKLESSMIGSTSLINGVQYTENCGFLF